MEEFINALKEQNAALKKEASELLAQNKGDESVFFTVRANVYDICATVLGVHWKRGDTAAGEAILNRFRREWGEALESAQRQNNAKKICVEETKLDALEDVISRFNAARCE